MTNNLVIADNTDYFLTHPPMFTIENVANVGISRTIFLEKNSSTLPVSSDAKFVAAQLNGDKYETLISKVYSDLGIKLLEGTADNGDFELQSRGTILQEVLACDGYKPDKTLKKRYSATAVQNAEEALKEVAFIQARIWKGNKYGLRSSMTRACSDTSITLFLLV